MRVSCAHPHFSERECLSLLPAPARLVGVNLAVIGSPHRRDEPAVRVSISECLYVGTARSVVVSVDRTLSPLQPSTVFASATAKTSLIGRIGRTATASHNLLLFFAS